MASKSRKSGLRTTRQRINADGAVVSGDRRDSRIVYGYRFPSQPGRIKIGYSSRGLRRVEEQSTAFPEMPELVFVIHHKDAAAIEKRLHADLARHQSDVMGTEWFDVSFDMVLAVSPLLRTAAGRGLWRRRLGFAGIGLIGAALVAAWGCILMACLWVSGAAGSASLVALERAYIDRLLAADWSGAGQMIGQVLDLLSITAGWPAWAIAATALHIPVSVLLMLRWTRTRS